MTCLRREIAAKIGPSAVSGESAVQQQTLTESEINQKASNEQIIEFTHDQDPCRDIWYNIFIDKCIEYKLTILIFFVAFALGRFFGGSPANQNSGQFLDLELAILEGLNVSDKIEPSPPPRSWSSPKFQRSHFQLNQLHKEFKSVRKSIWYTLQRVNELERRIYKAEMAAVMGDRLLACYDQKENPMCISLRKQWKSLLKGD